MRPKAKRTWHLLHWCPPPIRNQYTSLREQHVYRRAAKLYEAAFKLDPGESGRTLAAWLRRATPMESETASVDGSVGSQPPKRAKKSWAEAARAALPAA